MTLIRDIEGLFALQPRPRRLLSVFDHPDDEAYACIGALHRTATDPGGAAVHLSLTRGEASTILAARGFSPAEVGALGEQRLVRVAGHAKLDGLIVLDPTGHILTTLTEDGEEWRVRIYRLR